VHAPFEVAPGITVTFRRTGHIIGAASAHLNAEGVTLGFSGDVGRADDPVMRAPEPLSPVDYLVVESTYGDRRHPTTDVGDVLASVISDTAARGGVVLVPAFAVGRAQHMLHLIAELRAARRIPEIPVFLDSPMAIDATGVMRRHRGDHKLSDAQCEALFSVASYARTPDESKEIDLRTGPMIIVAASGMATGGRVLHHLQRFLPDERTTVLLVGFQAAGTRGRSLADGADELKLLGQYVPVRARVVQVEGLSAHADYREMLDWLAAGKLAPRRVFVTHGEPAAADAFRRRLRDTFGWDVTVPELGTVVELPISASP
jgi:metallo-beta-lactamase family protein